MRVFPVGLCTGCMACYNKCPNKAILISKDERGFDVPLADPLACTQCGQCRLVCPVLHPVAKNPQAKQALASWVNDMPVRFNSTSGGVFTALAQQVLEQGGVVFGAAFAPDWSVLHMAATNVGELRALRGSKYVQSHIGTTYRQAQEILAKGQKVLFSGTSCQIAGLYAYLGNVPEGLFTVDVLCHGAASPLFYHDYLAHITQGGVKTIMGIRFRYKKPGWTEFSMRVDFKEDTPYQASAFYDPYLCAFLKDYISRDCCHTCPYASAQRVADITLADFWGYVSLDKAKRNTEEGISLALVNSPRGQALFDMAQGQLVAVPKEMQEALRCNQGFERPNPRHPNANLFWLTYLKTRDFRWASQEIGKRRQPICHRASRWVHDHSYTPAVRTVRRAYQWARGKAHE